MPRFPALFALLAFATLHAAPVAQRPAPAVQPAPDARRLTPAISPAVIPGIEILLRDSLSLIRGKRVGLITNHTGRDRFGRRDIDLLAHAPGVTLTAVFAPEHGIGGALEGGARVGDTVDSATGVPVRSLYGESFAPSSAMLRDVDVLLYDVQDVGTRAYTFEWTAAMAARAAHRPFIVLDRPDPIRADIVEGGLIEPQYRSITGLYPVPVRYALTPGELLRWLAGTGQMDADVHVIPMEHYARDEWYDETGLPWIAPSPNIRTLDAALLYPGTVLFEATNLSEGRGTDAPLTMTGAPWLTDAAAIARTLNARGLPGIHLDTAHVSVARGEKFGGQVIPMILFRITDRDRARPLTAAALVLREVARRHPHELRFQKRGLEELTGSRAFRNAITGHGELDRLLARWDSTSAAFARSVERWRLYPPAGR